MAVFAAPRRYVQGRGALSTLSAELERLGASRALVLLDPAVEEVTSPALAALSGAEIVRFGGECSPSEIDRVATAASQFGADAVVAVGGGKSMDTAKAVAHPAGLSLVIAPTIASTDAPTSAVSVVYNEDGSYLEYRFWANNPDLVLVDTEVIARAPVRFLVAGIGDGLATWFEAESSATTRTRVQFDDDGCTCKRLRPRINGASLPKLDRIPQQLIQLSDLDLCPERQRPVLGWSFGENVDPARSSRPSTTVMVETALPDRDAQGRDPGQRRPQTGMKHTFSAAASG